MSSLFVCAGTGPEEVRPAAGEDASDAVHRRFLKESPAIFKDGVQEVSKDNEIAYSEVAKVPYIWKAKDLDPLTFLCGSRIQG